MDRQQVAIYGSLKRGFYNHHLMMGSEFIGEDCLGGFNLYSLGAFPGVKRGKGQLHVEVFTVDPLCFERLDVLEDHPNWYQREQVTTKFGLAWIYLYLPEVDNQLQVTSGNWLES